MNNSIEMRRYGRLTGRGRLLCRTVTPNSRLTRRVITLMAALWLSLSVGVAYALPANKSFGADACAAAAAKVDQLNQLDQELKDLENRVCHPAGVPPQYADRTNVYKQCLLVKRMLMWLQQEKSEAQMVVIGCHQQGLMDR